MAKKGTAGPKKTKLVLVGGDKPTVRQASRRDWTKEKEQAYIDALAETCNLTLAAAAAGVSTSSARRRRKSDARFRASCTEAVGHGYHRLELATLDRALNGTEKIITRKDGSEERVREYPLAVALTLLRMHRETALEADSEPDASHIEEARERLFHKLQRLRKRLDQNEENA